MVAKPSGLLSVPGRGPHLADCLLARVQAVFPEALLVHRLDRDTSGVMVFALSPHAQRHLGLQFEKRQVKKTYVARVWGSMAEDAGTVDLPLIVDWPNRPRQKVDFEAGRAAVTDWTVVRRLEQETRVRLMPKTGRSHQLRNALQDAMWEDAGVMRTGAGLARVIDRIAGIRAEMQRTGVNGANRAFNITWHDWLNLASLNETSQVIARAALARENSRGAHYREDFPDEGDLDSSYFTVATRRGDTVEVRREPVRFTIVKPGQTILPEGEPETLLPAPVENILS